MFRGAADADALRYPWYIESYPLTRAEWSIYNAYAPAERNCLWLDADDRPLSRAWRYEVTNCPDSG